MRGHRLAVQGEVHRRDAEDAERERRCDEVVGSIGVLSRPSGRGPGGLRASGGAILREAITRREHENPQPSSWARAPRRSESGPVVHARQFAPLGADKIHTAPPFVPHRLHSVRRSDQRCGPAADPTPGKRRGTLNIGPPPIYCEPLQLRLLLRTARSEPAWGQGSSPGTMFSVHSVPPTLSNGHSIPHWSTSVSPRAGAATGRSASTSGRRAAPGGRVAMAGDSAPPISGRVSGAGARMRRGTAAGRWR